ncbi:Protein transport protein yif1 [Microbotryomycetes sp. JL201]|nr:Protein transport protein yif1 [Microbotryomycetes sp. JL201]
MYGARSPPPLQHPRPQHPPSQIPSTSPPPPEFHPSQYQQQAYGTSHSHLHNRNAAAASHVVGDGGYERFSSPGATMMANSHNSNNAHDQQANMRSFHAYEDPYSSSSSSAASFGHQQPAPQATAFVPPSQPWMAGFGAATASGSGEGGAWPGMNDATAQMGMQFGKHAFDAGSAYIDKNITRMVPLAHLKHSFNVSNGYVLTKLRLVLFPWRHRPWSRSLKRSESGGVQQSYKPPREDINCPDLYIPVMSLVTYILLAAIYAGKQGQFDPQILGQTASKAFGILFLEFCCIKLGCYLLGIGEEGTMVDLLSYEGYKFVGVIVTLLAGLVGIGGWSFWLVFAYTLFANFFFQLRSLRHIILPDPAMTPLDQSTTANTGANTHSHAARSRRIQFLFMIAFAQGLSMAILVRV